MGEASSLIKNKTWVYKKEWEGGMVFVRPPGHADLLCKGRETESGHGGVY